MDPTQKRMGMLIQTTTGEYSKEGLHVCMMVEVYRKQPAPKETQLFSFESRW